MPRYIVDLSGESVEVSLAELIHSAGEKAKVLRQFNNLAIIDTKLDEKSFAKLSERTAMLKFSAVIIEELKSLLLKELDKVNWSFVKVPFAVRVIDLTYRQLPEIEARLAAPIYDYMVHHSNKHHPVVSLEHPKTTVLYVIDKRKIYVTKRLWKAEKARFKKRAPIKKPAFHPTSLKPKLARALVNLSGARKGDTLLDPFAGTGSVLIEASILGTKPIGIDIDSEMLSGARTNLKFYKQSAKLIQGNSTQLDKILKPNTVDAIATDPPYGRSSKIGAKNINTLYKEFFSSANKVLKKGKYLAALYPDSIKAKTLVSRKQWKVVFESELYVHGGLTRKFLVLRKL